MYSNIIRIELIYTVFNREEKQCSLLLRITGQPRLLGSCHARVFNAEISILRRRRSIFWVLLILSTFYFGQLFFNFEYSWRLGSEAAKRESRDVLQLAGEGPYGRYVTHLLCGLWQCGSMWIYLMKFTITLCLISPFFTMLISGESDPYSFHASCPTGENSEKWLANQWIR